MHKIDLSTIVFYKGELPRKLSLRDCSLPLNRPIQDLFVGVYGTRSKPEAFVAARAYAEAHGMQYTVIDVVVELQNRRLATVMQPGELKDYDFFSLLRMASAMNDNVRAWISAGLAADDERAAALEQPQPVQALTRDPSLLSVLARSAACRHLRLIACPVMTQFSPRPLNVGVVPHRHWAAITEATCRFDPTVHITLEKPSAGAAKLTRVPSSPRSR